MKITNLLASLIFTIVSSSAFAQTATCTATDISTSPFSWYSSWGRPDLKYFGVKVGDQVQVELTQREGRFGLDMKSGLLNYVEGSSGVESDPRQHIGFYPLNNKVESTLYFDEHADRYRTDINGPYKIIAKMNSEKDFDLEFNVFAGGAPTKVHATYKFKCQM